MTWIVSAVILILLFTYIGSRVEAARNRAAGGSSEAGRIEFPYQRGKPLFSAAERSFLGVLDQAVGPDNRVFAKVRVADVAAVMPGLGSAARQGALNRIAAKHFDFVVCRGSDLSVLCAVELNDGSHASARVAGRDELVANVCRVIGLPLLTVTVRHAYSQQDVREQFQAAVSPRPAREVPHESTVRLIF